MDHVECVDVVLFRLEELLGAEVPLRHRRKHAKRFAGRLLRPGRLRVEERGRRRQMARRKNRKERRVLKLTNYFDGEMQKTMRRASIPQSNLDSNIPPHPSTKSPHNPKPAHDHYHLAHFFVNFLRVLGINDIVDILQLVVLDAIFVGEMFQVHVDFLVVVFPGGAEAVRRKPRRDRLQRQRGFRQLGQGGDDFGKVRQLV